MKNLKKLQLIVLLLLPACFATAGTGKAIVPFWNAGTTIYHQTDIYITNISNNDVEVTVTIYKKDGTALTSGVTYVNFSASDTKILARNSGYVRINPTTSGFGFAIIEWNNTGSDDNTVALTAYAMFLKFNATVEGVAAIPINQGLPF